MQEFLQLAKRNSKPREYGLTCVIDRGIGLRQARDLLETSADYVDLIKLGWGTGYVTAGLSDKLDLYKEFNIPCYLGGTLFEISVMRDRFDEFRKALLDLDITHVEMSSRVVDLEIEDRHHYVKELSHDFTVLSEVGSKDPGNTMTPREWVDTINADLDAGAWKVITEARESGTSGICTRDGEIRTEVIDEIAAEIDLTCIIFEAPEKSHQAWFIKKYGSAVNLGNIAVDDVIPLEALRYGLRADTATLLDEDGRATG